MMSSEGKKGGKEDRSRILRFLSFLSLVQEADREKLWLVAFNSHTPILHYSYSSVLFSFVWYYKPSSFVRQILAECLCMSHGDKVGLVLCTF